MAKKSASLFDEPIKKTKTKGKKAAPVSKPSAKTEKPTKSAKPKPRPTKPAKSKPAKPVAQVKQAAEDAKPEAAPSQAKTKVRGPTKWEGSFTEEFMSNTSIREQLKFVGLENDLERTRAAYDYHVEKGESKTILRRLAQRFLVLFTRRVLVKIAANAAPTLPDINNL